MSEFAPTDDWQDVPDGAALPPGCEISMDFATGRNRARWAQQPSASAPLEAATQYLALGWSVIPLEPHGKRPPIVDPSTGRRMGWEPYQTRRTRPDEVERWRLRWPDANIGIVAGAVSGIVVADFDGPEGAELKATREIPPTPTARTGKGWHVFFKHPGSDVRNFARKMPGLDLRGDGGYVVAAPSIHESGAVYTWEVSPETPLADPPAWLMELIRPPAPAPDAVPTAIPTPAPSRIGGAGEIRRYAAKALVEELDRVRRATEGTRNDTLNKAAFALGQLVAGGELDRARIEYDLLDAALACGLGEHEARATIRSGLDDGMKEPRSAPPRLGIASRPKDIGADPLEVPPSELPTERDEDDPLLTDMGNSRRFALQHGANVKYTTGDGVRIWDGRRWPKDDIGLTMRLARRVSKALYREAEEAAARATRLIAEIEKAAEAGDDKQVKELQDRKLKADKWASALLKWALQSQSKPRLDAMVALAMSEPEIAAHVEQFDADPMLFNVANGTIDLRTGELRPHRREDLITRLSPVEYHPGATSDIWQRYLDTATRGDKELQRYLQLVVGYTLTGSTEEEIVPIVLGPAGSGKTTLMEALFATWGDYARRLPFDVLLVSDKARAGGGNTPELAQLPGVRLVIAVEAAEGRKLADGRLKELTGGDTISVCAKYHAPFEFKPAFKLWLAANTMPKCNDADDAIWRRLRKLPFEAAIPENERDPQVKAFLTDPKRGGPAILAWAIEGCLAWQREKGLKTAEVVRESTQQLRQSMDPLAPFIEARCVIGEHCYVKQSELRAAYEKWADEEGTKFRIGSRKWGERLRALGCTDALKREGTDVGRVWTGIGLRAESEAPQG